jgi:uncharacterized membrane protein HdeD (DUF308 family)
MEAQFQNRVWGGLALRGVAAILFGALALARPGGTAAALVYLFGAYAFVDGVFALVASAKIAQLGGRWWPMLLVGVVGLAVGILTFMRPAATALGLIYYIAAWAVLTGILEVAAAVRLRKLVQGEWMLALAGLLSIACGILIGARPAAGLLSVILVTGAFAIAFGVLLIGIAFRLRGAQKRLTTA